MKSLLLALCISVLPVAGSTAMIPSAAFAAATVTELGDLSPMRKIVADTLDLVTRGDLPGAATRITDFETAWDDAAGKLRKLSRDKWTFIDDASDAALAALRDNPQATDVIITKLNDLLAALDKPVP